MLFSITTSLTLPIGTWLKIFENEEEKTKKVKQILHPIIGYEQCLYNVDFMTFIKEQFVICSSSKRWTTDWKLDYELM